MKKILIIIIILFAAPINAQEIRIYTEDSPPFQFIDDSGYIAGITTEVIQETLSQIGISPQIIIVPWARGISILDNNPNTLLYSVMRTPDRENKYEWIGSIIPFKIYLWKLKSRTDVIINTLDDAKQYSLGMVNKNVEHNYLIGKGFSKFDLVNNSILNIKKLFVKRVDIVPYNSLILNFHLGNDKRLTGYNISSFQRLIELKEISKEAYLIMNKNSDPKLIEKFKNGLQQIKDNGIYQQILIKHNICVKS